MKFYCLVNVILILSFGKTWIIFLSSQFTRRWLQRMIFHQLIFKTVWIEFRPGWALCVYLHLFCTKPLFCISGNILPLIVFRYSIWGTLQKKFHYIKGEKSNILVNLFPMCRDLCIFTRKKTSVDSFRIQMPFGDNLDFLEFNKPSKIYQNIFKSRKYLFKVGGHIFYTDFL